MSFLKGLANLGSKLVDNGLIGAVGSIITSQMNAHQQKDINNANQYQNQLNREFTANQSELDRQFNASEAEKSRLFNANEAEKSRVFNAQQVANQQAFEKEMWNLQNEYNSPANQIDRLRSAGLNPNLYGGDNTAGAVGASSAATSSPASSSPASHGSVSAPSAIPMQPFVRNNDLMQAAQIKLMQAQAKKEMSESNKFDTESNRINALLNGELMIQDSTYKVHLSEAMRNDASAKESLKNLEVLDAKKNEIFASVDEIRQRISNLQKEGQLTQKELDSYEQRLGLELYEALSRVQMNGASATSYLASANASNEQAKLSKEQQKLVCQQVVHQTIQNDIARVDFRIKDKTETSTVQLINSANNLKTNDINVQNEDDWRFARLLFGTLGQVLNANLNISDVSRRNQ